MKSIVATALLLLWFASTAQASDREAALDSFARDLASVQAKIYAANANGARMGAAPASWHRDLAVLKVNAVVRIEPSLASSAVAMLPGGSQVEIVSQTDDWSGVLLGSGTSEARVGWVTNSAIEKTSGSYTQAEYASFAGEVLDTVIEAARGLLERTRDNPYVLISGFTTEIGLTGVSLSVQFEFK